MSPPHPHRYENNSNHYNLDNWSPHFPQQPYFKNQSHHQPANPNGLINQFSNPRSSIGYSYPGNGVTRHSYSPEQSIDRRMVNEERNRNEYSSQSHHLPVHQSVLNHNQNVMNNGIYPNGRYTEEWREEWRGRDYNQSSQPYVMEERRAENGGVPRHRINSEKSSGHTSSSSSANGASTGCNLSREELEEYATIIQDLWAGSHFSQQLKSHSISDYLRVKNILQKIKRD